jgi:hypothetical protein
MREERAHRRETEAVRLPFRATIGVDVETRRSIPVRHCRGVLLAATALMLALGVAATVAQAQEQVEFLIEAPAGNVDGFEVFGVTLFNSGAIIGEFNLPIISSGGFSSFSFTIPATELPDAVEVEFIVPSEFAGPSAGVLTTYSVTGTDFAFDQEYFLPNPSPGGVIGPQPGDPDDAFFELSLVTVEIPEDHTAPTCEIIETSPGVLEARLQDETGLEEVDVGFTRNLIVAVPPFTPGTTDLVTIVATVDNPDRTSVLSVKAVDGAGNQRLCKRILRRSSSTRSRVRSFRIGGGR